MLDDERSPYIVSHHHKLQAVKSTHPWTIQRIQTVEMRDDAEKSEDKTESRRNRSRSRSKSKDRDHKASKYDELRDFRDYQVGGMRVEKQLYSSSDSRHYNYQYESGQYYERDYSRHDYDRRDSKEKFKSKAQCRREDIQRILDDDDREEEENSSSFGSPSHSMFSNDKFKDSKA